MIEIDEKVFWWPLNRAFKGQKKDLENDEVTSNFHDFASRGFTEIIRSNESIFSEKICIKECLEIEITQVVCCGHPQNIYFMLNSSNIFHCVKPEEMWTEKGKFHLIRLENRGDIVYECTMGDSTI